MKLRNKETGEIGYFCFANWNDPVLIIMDKNGVQLAKYNSLAELNADWEDYEEDKYYWAITGIKHDGGITKMKNRHNDMTAFDKSIGNYFESKEEAEKAVEKLKAWKRLKDNGFKFDRWENDIQRCLGDFVIYAHTKDLTNIVDDLDLLFGGKQ